MKIVVFDLPATSGGALSILKSFYTDVKEYDDQNIEWYFILSTPLLEGHKNIKVRNYPWVKKSWFHRLFFDYIYSKIILKDIQPDKIFSLQNTSISKHYKQAIYLHQGLPLSKYKFKFKKNKKLWLYQNIIGKIILNSLKKADKVIVQTCWMKDACVNKLPIDPNNIVVIPPSKKEYNNVSKNTISNIFFYPSSEEEYKNHDVIVKATEMLKDMTEEKFDVVLTLDPLKGKKSKKMYEYVQKKRLPIEFKGMMEKSEVLKMYETTTLLYPSYIESFGLPLLEAQEKNAMILAANEPYAREVLNNYNNAYYFDTFNAEKLAYLMLSIINQKYKVKEGAKKNGKERKGGLVKEIINF